MANCFVGTSREGYKEAVFPWEHCYTSGFDFLKQLVTKLHIFSGSWMQNISEPADWHWTILRSCIYDFTLFQQGFFPLSFFMVRYIWQIYYFQVLQFKHKYFQIFIHMVKKIRTWHSFLCVFRLNLRCFSCLLTMKLHLELKKNLTFKKKLFFLNWSFHYKHMHKGCIHNTCLQVNMSTYN